MTIDLRKSRGDHSLIAPHRDEESRVDVEPPLGIDAGRFLIREAPREREALSDDSASGRGAPHQLSDGAGKGPREA